MLESFADVLPMLIPVLALLIGLVVIGGIFIVQPLVKAITRLVDAQDQRFASVADQKTHRLEQQIASLERAVHALTEEREFDRGLRAGSEPLPMSFEARDSARDA
jgi:hypothetical protein